MATDAEIISMKPADFWKMVRKGQWQKPTIMPCQDYLRAGLCIIPREYALEFLTFCQRNPQPLPVIDILEAGDPHPFISPGADIRTDLPKYDVFINGNFKETVTDIKGLWRDDLVAILLGCGVGVDGVFRQHNIPVISIHALHKSTILCQPAGRFHGPMAVAGRLFNNMADVVRAVQISSRMPLQHGAPVHIGDPAAIGIHDIFKGQIVSVPKADLDVTKYIPVFWACGCTLGLVAKDAGIPLMITQSPSYMFVTDRLLMEMNRT
jgi:uncharacterized protein YcsI (UPF0317 family)